VENSGAEKIKSTKSVRYKNLFLQASAKPKKPVGNASVDKKKDLK
jgi:hypothetical protein